MCSGIGGGGGMSPGMGAGLGFGLDVLGAFGQYGEQRRQTREANRSIALQNQLAINAYNTKNRNEENIWRNSKIDSDIEVDNKWRETQDALAEAQFKARQAAGEAAISQQRILAKMLTAGGREQSGRRSGRKGIAELGAQLAAAGAQAAFAKESEILFRDKAGRNMAAFAQGKYVEYITGRPSPEAPPLLQEFKQGPSFFNTALSIASSGLNRYQQYQDKKAPNAYQNFSGNRSSDYMPPDSQNPFIPQPNQAPSQQMSMGGAYNTFDLPQFSSPASFTDNQLQTELNDYFSKPSAGESLNFGVQQTFGN